MSTHSILLGLLILIAILSSSPVEAQSSSSIVKDSSDERARICSIFGAVVANAEAIKQGDVLFLERNFYDGFTFNAPPDEGTLDEFRLVRVVFDDEQGKFLILSRTISEWLVLRDVTPENDGRKIKANDMGSLCDRPSGMIDSKEDNLVYKSSGKSRLPDHLLELWADPRTVGMFECGLGPLSRGVERHLNNLTGEKLLDWKTSKEGFHLRNATAVPNDPNFDSVESFVFDHDSNLPTRFDSYGESKIAGGGRSIPHYSSYEWQAMSGLHVPFRLKGSTFCGYNNPDEKRISARLTVDFNFHWFSINEPIPDELFDATILSDSKRFQDLIDPRKANATELIEIIEKLDPKYKLAPDKEPTAPK